MEPRPTAETTEPFHLKTFKLQTAVQTPGDGPDAQVLVERFKDKIVMQDVLTNHEGLQGLVLDAFQAADPQGSGALPLPTVKSVLRQLSFEVLGLSTLQLVTLLSRANTTADGLVNYVPFVPVVSTMVYSMYDVDAIKLRIQAVKQVCQCVDVGCGIDNGVQHVHQDNTEDEGVGAGLSV